MKRMTTALLAATLAGGTLGVSSVALAEVSFYGSVRSGIVHNSENAGNDASWDLGSVDSDDDSGTTGDKLWSRIGVKASHDLGNGLTGGLHVERRLDRFRLRHQNVWLGGPFGRVTLGQQGTVYHSAVSWDGTYLYGGNSSFDTSRSQGIKYSSALDGPFSFNAMISDDNLSGGGQGNGLDKYEVSAGFNMADVASVSLAYLGQSEGRTDYYGGSVSGSVGGVSWDVGYEKSNADDAQTHYGAFVGYAGAYVYYEDLNTESNEGENHHILLGYSYAIGNNTRLILEHLRPDEGAKKTALALRVDF